MPSGLLVPEKTHLNLHQPVSEVIFSWSFHGTVILQLLGQVNRASLLMFFLKAQGLERGAAKSRLEEGNISKHRTSFIHI